MGRELKIVRLRGGMSRSHTAVCGSMAVSPERVRRKISWNPPSPTRRTGALNTRRAQRPLSSRTDLRVVPSGLTMYATSSWLLPRSPAIGWLNEEDAMSSIHLWWRPPAPMF